MVTGGIIMVDRWVSGGPDEVMQLKDSRESLTHTNLSIKGSSDDYYL